MDHRFVSVLLLPIVPILKPSGNRRRPILPSSNFRWLLYALIERPDLFRNRQGLWFLDNVAVVMALVRGRSSNPDLAKLSHLIHLALFAMRAQGYWEYVQSKSNWADDISRLGLMIHGGAAMDLAFIRRTFLPSFSTCFSLQSSSPLNSSSALGVVVRWVIPEKAGSSLGSPGSSDEHWTLVWGYARVTP